MEAEANLERVDCPACGGAGGGPFGRAGSAWDTEDYECPRCRGTGVLGVPRLASVAIEEIDLAPEEPSPVSRPGVAKTTPKKIDRKRAAGDEE